MRKVSILLFFIMPISVFAQTVAEKMDEYLASAEKLGLFSGSVLVIEKGNTLLYKGYGYKDVAVKAINDENTIYQIGSLTKQFTSAIILKLQEQGKLNIEDKLSKYFIDFPKGDKITLEHLLTHTSGIFNITRDSTISSQNPTSRDKILSVIIAKPFDFEPGTNYRYNNSGYILLGYIIEQVTGKKYESVVREYILKPLQMNNTGFDFKNLNHSDKAVGYNFIAEGKGVLATQTDSTFSFSAGGIYSTLLDLDKWNRALLTEKILNKSSLKKTFTPKLANYGLGWKIDSLRGKLMINHTGFIPGFKSYNIILPEEKSSIIILSNFSSFNEAKASKDLLAILNNQPYELPKTESEVKVDEKVLQQYVGEYQLSPASSIKIRLQNGQLKGQITGQAELDLFAKSEKLFFLKVADVQLEFVKNEKGEVEKLITYQGGRQRTGIKVK